MPKRKKSVEALIAEIVQDKLEVELHRQLRKARGAVVRHRKKTEEQVVELMALPLPNTIDVDDQLDLFSKEEAQEVEEDTEQDRD